MMTRKQENIERCHIEFGVCMGLMQIFILFFLIGLLEDIVWLFMTSAFAMNINMLWTFFIGYRIGWSYRAMYDDEDRKPYIEVDTDDEYA